MSMMPHTIDFKLSERDKRRFEAKAKKITERDVVEVMTKFGEKLDELEKWIRKSKLVPDFLATFVSNLKLIYELLSDPSFRVSWTTKSWLVFALGYFIMPLDLIPDYLPIVGYFDDYTVLLWVMHICSDEIDRYRGIRRGRKASESNNLVLLQRGSSNRRIILATGFLSKPESAATYKPWINSIRSIDRAAHIYSFVWDTKDITELLKTANFATAMGRNPFLATSFSIGRICQIWKDAVLNTSTYSSTMVKDIENMQKGSKKRLKITLVGHSLGARLICNALSVADKGLITDVFTVGGAVANKALWFRHAQKIKRHVNCFSKKDSVLAYIYRIAERGEQPIGLHRIGKTDSKKRIEFDCTEFVTKHSGYAATGESWFLS